MIHSGAGGGKARQHLAARPKGQEGEGGGFGGKGEEGREEGAGHQQAALRAPTTEMRSERATPFTRGRRSFLVEAKSLGR